MSTIAAEPTVATLLDALKDFRTRAAARRALEKRGAAAAAEPLLALATRAEAAENVRWAALDLLGRFAYAPAAPACVALLRNEPRLRDAVLDALRRITGSDPGDRPEDWERLLAGGTAAAPTADTGTACPPELALAREALADEPVQIRWETDGGYLHLQFALANGRLQQLVVSFAKDPRSGDLNAIFYTECGASPDIARIRTLVTSRTATLHQGRFFLEPGDAGTTKISLRLTLAKASLTAERLRDLAVTLAREADSFEADLTGSDQI